MTFHKQITEAVFCLHFQTLTKNKATSIAVERQAEDNSGENLPYKSAI